MAHAARYAEWRERPEGTIRHLRFAPDGSRLTALVDYDGLLDFDIDPATDAGCDAVKFQKRTVEVVYTPGRTPYRLVVENPSGVSRGIIRQELDGVDITGRDVPIVDDGVPRTIKVVLGEAPDYHRR